jgi:OmpA-OmpF porin, OOP family
VASQFSYGFGLRITLVKGLKLAASFTGLTGISGTMGLASSPMEVVAGPEYRFARVPFELVFAAGTGLTDGLGAPNARALFALRYAPRTAGDRDHDGLDDEADRCPDEPGPRESRGCPDRDSDGDFIPDRDDACPGVPGPRENAGCPLSDRDRDGLPDSDDRCPTVAGPKENGGCPDTDGDGDGVIDRLDRCAKVPGPKENGGCPWLDSDGDGVNDKEDRCPDKPGTRANDGCPDLDSDGDGIVDRLDKCPFEPETFNGVDDDDGCPDKGKPLAQLMGEKIEISEKVQFATGKSKILPASFLLLATVAKIMTLHPEITKIRVEGHTDNIGGRTKNVALSQARADAVRQHLIKVNGVAAERLVAKGYAFDRPLGDNKKESGRAKNRRVEFIVIERKTDSR